MANGLSAYVEKQVKQIVMSEAEQHNSIEAKQHPSIAP